MEEKKGALLLGTENIGKLLKKYAMPAIIAMTASSLYNMVDSIFIGHGVGAMAISGLAITFPFMNLAAALGSLVGVGASTVTAIELGKKNYDKGCKALANTLILNIFIGIIFSIICLIFLKPILYFLEQVKRQCHTHTITCLSFSLAISSLIYIWVSILY